MSEKKATLVIGAGKSGIAAANYLARRHELVRITDDRAEENLPLLSALDPRVERHFAGANDQLLADIRLVVLSPGVPLTAPLVGLAKQGGVPVISEIELAWRNLTGTVVAISGSNGKSTTTALIGEILRAAGRQPVVAGNIGTPLIEVVDVKPRDYVVELSSFQLETTDTFHADVAVLLNITPDHLDRYPDMDSYAQAKYRLFANQTQADVAVVNADDARTNTPPTDARVLRFSSSSTLEQGAFLDGQTLVLRFEGSEERITRSALSIPGVANVENALASWLVARVMRVESSDVESAFRSFRGLPHRMVLVRELDGVRYINDSKGTNVDATLKSLEGFEDQKVVLVLGGKDKKGEFERLRPLVSRKVRIVLTIGSAAGRIHEALEAVTRVVDCCEMASAVRLARGEAKSGDTVLLSPACASFDQYQNFEQRGTHFEELVNAMGESSG